MAWLLIKKCWQQIQHDAVSFYIFKSFLVCIFASYFIISRIFSSLSKLSSVCWFFSLQVIVPLPSWDSNTKKPLTSDPEKYAIETELIFKYSPFKDEQQLMEQFNKIESSSGKHMHLSQCKYILHFSYVLFQHFAVCFKFIYSKNVPFTLLFSCPLMSWFV